MATSTNTMFVTDFETDTDCPVFSREQAKALYASDFARCDGAYRNDKGGQDLVSDGVFVEWSHVMTATQDFYRRAVYMAECETAVSYFFYSYVR